MANKATSKAKSKKVIETTLGKAPTHSSEESIDLSQLRRPIQTSLFGLHNVLNLFETATDEVRRYVAYECDLIYECRVCRSLHRSLANFILHKRNYCRDAYKCRKSKDSFNNFQHPDFNLLKEHINKFDCTFSANLPTDPDSNDSFDSFPDLTELNKRKKKGLGSVLKNLYDKQASDFITEQCLSEDVSNESQNLENDGARKNAILQNLNNANHNGVYQTLFSNLGKMDFMKTEVMEIHDVLENNEAIIGSNGKILANDNDKNSVLKNNYRCNVCHQTFSTKKTLTYHIRFKHNNNRLVYPCTECKDLLPSASSVFRHLYKVHQKSTAYVRKRRNIIHASAIKRSDYLEQNSNMVLRSRSNVEAPEKSTENDQQWMDNFEGDNDLQRCGGCGRRYDRKAALHSHSQFCAKRIAACNALKENNSKKITTDEKINKPVQTVKCDSIVTERVCRRKPLLTYKVVRFSDCPSDTSILEDFRNHLPNPMDTPACSTSNIEDVPEEVVADTISETDYVRLHSPNDLDKEIKNDDDKELVPAEDENKDELECQKELSLIDDSLANEDSAPVINNLDIVPNSSKPILEDLELDVSNITEPSSSCNSSFLDESTASLVNTCRHTLAKKSLNYIDSEKQTCIPCKKPFHTRKSLMKHMSFHFSWYRYHCNICKYRSYTKSKCKHHLVSKHSITDKSRLSSLVKRFPYSKTLESSTSFIKHYKRKKLDLPKPVDVITINDNEDIQNNVITPKTDQFSTDLTCDKIQDPQLREMVRTVIFGTQLVSPTGFGDHSDIMQNDIDMEESDPTEFENPCAPIPTEIQIQDCSRPVRTRVTPKHKDFLYEPHIVKKQTKERKLKPKIKLRAKPLKHSKKLVKNLNLNENSINCVRLLNNNPDITIKHVTGDVV